MGKCAVFVDAGYFEKVRELIYGGAAVDYRKLIDICVGEHELLRAFYYGCKPVIRKGSKAEDRKVVAKFESFLGHLKAIPKLEIRLGRLVYVGDKPDGTPAYRQQQVDTLLACDLLALVFTREITHATLIAGDGDFVPLIKEAKKAGISVTLWYAEDKGLRPYKYLKKICNERRLFTPEVVANTTLKPNYRSTP